MNQAKKPRVVLIIQARMGSTRLPGKILKTVLGKPLLAYLVERVRRAKTVDEVVLATTTNPNDGQLVDFCNEHHLACFRGSEDNVLDRYLQAARKYHADVIVRTTSDCPLIDPSVIDDIVTYFLKHYPEMDYASNCVVRTYPRGMDVEVFSMSSFEKVAIETKKTDEQEHVTPYYYRHPELFKLGEVTRSHDDSHYRWTVDEEADFQLIKTILEDVYPSHPHFSLDDLLKKIKIHPEWVAINAHVRQKHVGK